MDKLQEAGKEFRKSLFDIIDKYKLQEAQIIWIVKSIDLTAFKDINKTERNVDDQQKIS